MKDIKRRKCADFILTEQVIYENCSNRIRNLIKEKNLKHKDVFPTDPKMVSRIINRKTTDRNPYLIQYAVLCEIASVLDLDNKTIIWGTNEEIEFNLPIIFQSIIFDLLVLKNDISKEIDTILCGYIPYARYSAYRKLIIDESSTSQSITNAHKYNIDYFELHSSIEARTDEAICFLYKQCHQEFLESYLRFTAKNNSLSMWHNKLMDWIKSDFIEILRPFTPTADSLGIRIMKLISTDYLYFPQTTMSCNEENSDINTIKKLIDATEKYITELENIQKTGSNYSLFL